VDADGQAEIIVSGESANASEIKIFNTSGQLKNFFLPLENFKGGYNLSVK